MRLGQIMANAYGWAGGLQWGNLAALWTRESGWNNMAYNRNGGATGIPQSLPYSKMPRAAWLPFQGGQASAPAQIGWGLAYIKGRWNDPVGAYSGAGAGGVTGAAYDARGDWYATGGQVGGPFQGATARLSGAQHNLHGAITDILSAKEGKGWKAAKGTGLNTGKTVGIPHALVTARKKIAAALHRELAAYGIVDSDAHTGTAVLPADISAMAASLAHLGADIGPDAEKYLPDDARRARDAVSRERHSLDSAASTWKHAMLPDSQLDDAQKWNRYAALALEAGSGEERAAKPLEALSFTHLAHSNPKLARALTHVRNALRAAQAAFAKALSNLNFRRAPSQIPAGAWQALEMAERHVRRITGGGRGSGGGGGGQSSGGNPPVGGGPVPPGFQDGGIVQGKTGGPPTRHHRDHHARGGGPPVAGGGVSEGIAEFRDREHAMVASLAGALGQFSGYEHRAHKIWRAMQVRQHSGPPTPGIGGGSTRSNAPPPVDVYSLISGGPSAGSYGNVPGFAMGGMPRMSFARPMASGGSAGFGHLATPRTLSAAAAASGARTAMGGGGGISIGHMEIKNPVAEKAGESVTRAVQRSAFLAGRGVA
jgi:hypothetical protein